MFDGLLQTNSVPLLEQVVNFSHARHNLLAGNIANLDTPGYRAVDLDTAKFEDQLRTMLASQKLSDAEGSEATEAFAELRKPGQHGLEWGNLVRHDDGDVSLEHQIAQLSKNQMQHNLALTIMTNQFRLLQAAITERP
jgi:flagellar basal-body rod protein FlgB